MLAAVPLVRGAVEQAVEACGIHRAGEGGDDGRDAGDRGRSGSTSFFVIMEGTVEVVKDRRHRGDAWPRRVLRRTRRHRWRSTERFGRGRDPVKALRLSRTAFRE